MLPVDGEAAPVDVEFMRFVDVEDPDDRIARPKRTASPGARAASTFAASMFQLSKQNWRANSSSASL